MANDDRESPNRLVYLRWTTSTPSAGADGWDRLKGAIAERTRAAAGRAEDAGCEAVLGVTGFKELGSPRR